MVRIFTGALALVCATALAGCATVVHGTVERVQVDSTPGGAEVAIDDAEQEVTTPAWVWLARRRGHKLVFHKPGFHDATEHVTSTPSGWVLGNVIAGGVIGATIDESDGAARKLSSDKVFVTLTPLPPDSKASSPPQAQSEELPEPHSEAFHRLENVLNADHALPAAEPTRPEGASPERFTGDDTE